MINNLLLIIIDGVFFRERVIMLFMFEWHKQRWPKLESRKKEKEICKKNKFK